MRIVSLTLATLVVLLAGLIGWYRWDSSKNRGTQTGYYGEFNRVSNALASIPGVTVTQAWQNLDITLEEFGFGITVTGQPVRLYFGERDPIRSMRRDAAVSALRSRIETELTTTRTNR
jgi:hypothetical protein